LDLEFIPLWVDVVDFGMVKPAETGGFDIAAAGEDDPIQTRKEIIEGIEGKVGREEGGQGACFDQSEEIRFRRGDDGIVVFRVDVVAGGEADEGEGHNKVLFTFVIDKGGFALKIMIV